ncbi:MAG: hypothetical protein PHE25_04180 [Candidatus Gracilibacteria bacterium]|nr:hypothetical protein [Candidatus Gracilibacteria bacterium]
MNTKNKKKLFSLIIGVYFSLFITTASADFVTVSNYLNILRSTDTGYIGYILGEIFGTSGTSLGKIQQQYLDLTGIGGGGSGWLLTGNSGTTLSNYIGTSDDKDVIFKRNGILAGLLNYTLGNTSWGVKALNSNTTGTNNVAVGLNSLYSNTSGINNTANGVASLQLNTTGNNNTAIGDFSLSSNTSGSDNTTNGHYSLFKNTTGVNNTAIGVYSLYANTTGYQNTANGANSLNSNTTGVNNTAIGAGSLKSNTSGDSNTAGGFYSLYSNTTGIENTAFGLNSLTLNTTGNSNTAVGGYSLGANTTGYQNTANGINSLNANTTGYNNTAAGAGSLQKNTTGYYNTANGFQSLTLNTTGYYNTANGGASLYSNTTGYQNTANGIGSLQVNTTGVNNTANGGFSLFSNTTGNNNTANGLNTLYSNTTGGNNTANGINSLYYNNGGTDNTALGTNAGVNWSYYLNGSYNTFLGDSTTYTDSNITNSTAVGANVSLSNSNTVILGNNANVGIGTSSPNYKLDVSGTGNFTSIHITSGAGSGKVLMSDTSGNASWQTIVTAVGNCSFSGAVINSHLYNVPAISNGNSFKATATGSITNGTVIYDQIFTCSLGTLLAYGGETPQYSCSYGYIWDAVTKSCLAPTNNNCSSSIQIINGRTYTVTAFNHQFTTTSNSTSSITNGTQVYRQSFYCNNGIVSTYGSESLIANSCNSGYGWNGTSCVSGSSIDPIVASTFSGTTCPTVGSVVVYPTAGVTNSIPNSLSANTVYYLQAGTYPLTQTVNMANCSAIVGAGTGSTFINFVGISSNSTDMIYGNNITNAYINNLSMNGGAGGGSSRYDINIGGTTSQVGLNNLVLSNAGSSDINLAGTNFNVSNIVATNSSTAINILTGNSIYNNITTYSNQTGISVVGSYNTLNGILAYNNANYGLVLQRGYANNQRGVFNTIITNAELYNNNSGFGSFTLLNNSTFTNFKVHDNIYGINFQNYYGIGSNNTLNNFDVYNNTQVGIHLYYLYNSNFYNIKSYNNGGDGIYFYNNLNNLAFSNIQSFNNGGIGLNISSSNTSSTFSNMAVYNNAGGGINLLSSNMAFSNMAIYNNTGYGVTTTGNSNFYYGTTSMFGNTSGNITGAGTFAAGKSSDWSGYFSNGNLVTTDTFSSPTWVTLPTNVTGWNTITKGRQTGLTWPTYPSSVTYSYGSSIASQTVPIASSTCNLSSTATTPCSPDIIKFIAGYNSANKIGQW